MKRRAGRRVVVTGVGLVSPVGSTLAEMGEAVLAGRSAAEAIRTFDATLFGTHFAAQVSPDEWSAARRDPLAGPLVRVDDTKSAYGILAARRAIESARLRGAGLASDRIAIVLGTGLSSINRGELEEDLLPFLGRDGELDLRALGRSLDGRNATWSPARHLTDQVNRAVSVLCGASGRSLSHFGACAASTQAIGDAYRLVREYGADAVVAGGMDSMVHPFGMISFMLLGALSTRNADPSNGCRPFHTDRDGFLLGEGAAMFVLEDRQAAIDRKAAILAEVVGYGSSVDGWNVTAPRPDGAGAAAAMRAALADAMLSPEDVGWVNAHGTGTALNDPAEAKAVQSVFGKHAEKTPISSLKPVFGHAVAAAGAMEVAATLACMKADGIPPTRGLNDAAIDAEARGLDHVLSARRGSPEFVMTNNYGFGGQNASLILRRLA